MKCRKNTESKNPKVAKIKKRKPIFSVVSICVVCGRAESRFIKKQEAIGLLIGPNSPLNKIPILGTNF